MKRTEKIEIRVSLEEKQTLAQLAKEEGESVSGLIRGLVDKYMALNTASTTRRLPKWKMAAGFILAVFLGHGLTLLPMHLHQYGHQSADTSMPVYMVHGAIDKSAFGVGLHAEDRIKELTLNAQSDNPLTVRLEFDAHKSKGGRLKVTICEAKTLDNCADPFKAEMGVDRIAPSVLGNSTQSGKPIHIFVQEMA